MSGSTSESQAYDAVTQNHDEIRRWVRQHGGQPALASDESDDQRLTVQFPDSDGDSEAISWDEFFDRFEDSPLAFAYASESSDGSLDSRYRFVAEDADLDELDETGNPADEGRRGGASRETDHDMDERSEIRENAARESENVDNHRDEPPFES